MFRNYFGWFNRNKEKLTVSAPSDLQIKLYNILCECEDSVLTPKLLREASKLLDKGVKANYIPRSHTIVQHLVMYRQLEALKLVLAKQPESCNFAALSDAARHNQLALQLAEVCNLPAQVISTDNMLTDEEFAYEKQRDALHLAAEYLHYRNEKEDIEIYNLIKKHYNIPDRYKFDLNNFIKNTYNAICAKIEAAIQNPNKKPFLLNYGESHESFVDALFECIVVFAAHQYGVKIFFRELDSKDAKIVKENEKGRYYHSIHSPIKLVKDFMKRFNLEILPSDVGRDESNWEVFKKNQESKGIQLAPSSGIHLPPRIKEVLPYISDAAIRYRNSFIVNEYRKHSSESVMGVVGLTHVYGINLEENLNDSFNVISLCNPNDGEMFTNEKKTTQVNVESNGTNEDTYRQKSTKYLDSGAVFNLGFNDDINAKKIYLFLETLNPHQVVDYILKILLPLAKTSVNNNSFFTNASANVKSTVELTLPDKKELKNPIR